MIFYEKEQAENLLKNGFTSFMSFDDLSLLARYFKYLGKNKSQIRKDLIDFCKKYNPDFNEILSWNKIKGAVNYTDKCFLRIPSDIIITESELEIVKNIGDYKKQKIAFVILVTAKYFKYNDNRVKPGKKTEYSDNFYAKIDTTSLLKLARVTMKKDDFTKVLYDFHHGESITMTGVSSYEVHFVDENSPIAIKVTDLDRMIDFYPLFCERCGKIIEKKSKRHSFCNDCYISIRRETWAESKRKIRKSKNVHR